MKMRGLLGFVLAVALAFAAPALANDFGGPNPPNCTDTGGNHLNYSTSTNAYSCGTSAPSSSPPTPSFAGYTTCSSTNVSTCNTNDTTPSTWAWSPGDLFLDTMNTGTGVVTAMVNTAGGFYVAGLSSGSASSQLTVSAKLARGELSTVNPVTSTGGQSNFGSRMHVIHCAAPYVAEIDQFKGFGGSSLPVTLPVMTTLRNNELFVYACFSNNANVTVTGTGISTVLSTAADGISTSTLATAGAGPTPTCQTTGGAGSNVEGIEYTVYCH